MILVIKRFRLRQGVDEGVFVEVDARLQREFTERQPGLLGCTTARTTAGEWLVIHTWESHQAADAPSGRGAAVVDEWAELIDESTATIERFAPQHGSAPTTWARDRTVPDAGLGDRG